MDQLLLPNGVLDRMYNLWFLRCMFPVLLGLFVYGVWLVYTAYLRKLEVDARVQIALARLEQKSIIVNRREMATEIERPAPTPDSVIVTMKGARLSKKKVIEFVTRALDPDGPALGIGKWKSEEGWAQSDIENVIDYLSDLGMCTPRQNGRASEWLRGYRAEEALRVIADDQRDMEYIGR